MCLTLLALIDVKELLEVESFAVQRDDFTREQHGERLAPPGPQGHLLVMKGILPELPQLDQVFGRQPHLQFFVRLADRLIIAVAGQPLKGVIYFRKRLLAQGSDNSGDRSRPRNLDKALLTLEQLFVTRLQYSVRSLTRISKVVLIVFSS